MLVIVEDREYDVSWKNTTVGKAFKYKRHVVPKGSIMTTCAISLRVVSGYGSVLVGRSFCVPGDKFDKLFGQKKSLERTLETYHFSKEARTEFWAAFFAAKKVPFRTSKKERNDTSLDCTSSTDAHGFQYMESEDNHDEKK